jgi:hypothetical protein
MKNLPAFPVSEEETDRIDEGVKIYSGLTKREYFAAKAMQGLITNPKIIRPDFEEEEKSGMEDFSEIAVKYADGLIKALSVES